MTKGIKFRDFLTLEFFVLFLCSIEFLSKFYSLIILLFFVVWMKGFLKDFPLHTKNFIYLVSFVLSYLVFAYKDVPIMIVPVWLLSYVIGYGISNNSKRFFETWFLIAFGIALHSLLIFYFNINQFGVDAMGNRIMHDIWGGGLMRGATTLACSFLLGSAIVVPFFNYQKTRIWPILFVIFIIYGVFFNSVSTASRSALVYPALIIAISYFPLMEKKNRTKYLSLALFIITFITVLYVEDAFGIRSFFENQYLYERFSEKEGGGIVENQRLDLWKYFFAHIDQYMFGGGTFSISGDRDYVHNIILDTFAIGGIVPSLFLTLLLINFIKSGIRLYKKSDEVYFMSLILGLMFGFLLIFMTEPIIQAANWFFSFFLMLVGGLDRINNLKSKGVWA